MLACQYIFLPGGLFYFPIILVVRFSCYRLVLTFGLGDVSGGMTVFLAQRRIVWAVSVSLELFCIAIEFCIF